MRICRCSWSRDSPSPIAASLGNGCGGRPLLSLLREVLALGPHRRPGLSCLPSKTEMRLTHGSLSRTGFYGDAGPSPRPALARPPFWLYPSGDAACEDHAKKRLLQSRCQRPPTGCRGDRRLSGFPSNQMLPCAQRTVGRGGCGTHL